MSLRLYQRKRHFNRTAEPRGHTARAKAARGDARGDAPLQFVIQKHAASHLHYDFRLEWAGTLKSWAVPKGPSLDPADKRLAVEVEDHPLEYATFEGTIPQGEYGGGTVMVWDRGKWTPKPGTDPAAALRAGRLEFDLAGEKLSGGWILVRMGTPKPGQKPQWLLRKRQDAAAKPADKFDVLKKHPLSVKTARTLEQIAEGKDAQWSSGKPARTKKPARARASTRPSKPANPIDIAGAKRSPLPGALEPQLATLVDAAPEGDNWIHEIKFDGYRILAFVNGNEVRLISRNGKDWTKRFSAIAAAVRALKLDTAILDGEAVAVDAHGRSSFQSLQQALDGSGKAALDYFVFDLPYFSGHDLRELPLRDRRAALQQLLGAGNAATGIVRFSDAIEGHGANVLQHACKLALEGIISKRSDAPYTSGRTTTWVKSKCTNRQEMVIGGFTDPRNSRQGFGALLIGYYQGDDLLFAGKVGTGFDDAMLRSLVKRLRALERPTPPFTNPPRGAEARDVHWVRPELVCEIEFYEWTRDGRMRHPAFIELREDKDAREVVREKRKPIKAAAASATSDTPRGTTAAKKSPRAAKPTEDATVLGVPITHPDREVFPDVGVTKLQLARYYASIADLMMPHVRGRPLSVVRCPQGQGSQCFYQKNWEKGETLGSHTIRIRLASATLECLVLDDPSGLVWLAQRGVLEVHTWGCTEDDLERPDRMVFDLDPAPDVPWPRVVSAARRVRDALDSRGLQSIVKTTGGKGLHVGVPLKPSASWKEVKEFSHALALEIAAKSPDEYTTNMSKAKRTGRVFIDYLRNGRGATFVAPFSSRSRPGAPVSVPIAWKDLEALRSPPTWGVRDEPDWRARAAKAWLRLPAAHPLPE